MNAQPKNKRVVFTMGGKGGVGKTGLMVALAELFEANEIRSRCSTSIRKTRHGALSSTSSTGQ